MNVRVSFLAIQSLRREKSTCTQLLAWKGWRVQQKNPDRRVFEIGLGLGFVLVGFVLVERVIAICFHARLVDKCFKKCF